MRLKLECQQVQVKNDGMLDEICNNYLKSMELTKDSDLDDLFEHIHHARSSLSLELVRHKIQ